MRVSASTSFLRSPPRARSFSFKSVWFIVTSRIPKEWPQSPELLAASAVNSRAVPARLVKIAPVFNQFSAQRTHPAFLSVEFPKNVKTLWREAEKLLNQDDALQMVDPLYVIETVMRYFYSLAQAGNKANAPL